MGDALAPESVKLIAGLLAAEDEHFALARTELEARFGAIDLESDIWPFGSTHYYEGEIGPTILRRFVSFDELIPPDRLAPLKLATNELELQLRERLGTPPGQRPINIDPGYVTLGSLVLATTKNRAHRIYLRDGIYAEVTLTYERGGWAAAPWTYPDYAAPTYHAFLTAVRERLKQVRRRG